MASLGQQLLERLVEKLGGPDQAAARLGITDTLMRHLLSGALPVTDSILLKAVDALDAPPEFTSAVPPKTTIPKGPAAT
jgi:hypothetical protein